MLSSLICSVFFLHVQFHPHVQMSFADYFLFWYVIVTYQRYLFFKAFTFYTNSVARGCS